MVTEVTPEEMRILKEDTVDLYDKTYSLIRTYMEDTSFHLRDKAALFALSNLVGNFFNGYSDEGAKDHALDVFIEIVTTLLQRENI